MVNQKQWETNEQLIDFQTSNWANAVGFLSQNISGLKMPLTAVKTEQQNYKWHPISIFFNSLSETQKYTMIRCTGSFSWLKYWCEPNATLKRETSECQNSTTKNENSHRNSCKPPWNWSSAAQRLTDTVSERDIILYDNTSSMNLAMEISMLSFFMHIILVVRIFSPLKPAVQHSPGLARNNKDR